MADTTIRVSEEAKRRLDLFKREGESYDDAILRLTSTDKWAGFGALADTGDDTSEGLSRVREGMREGMDEDVEATESR